MRKNKWKTFKRTEKRMFLSFVITISLFCPIPFAGIIILIFFVSFALLLLFAFGLLLLALFSLLLFSLLLFELSSFSDFASEFFLEAVPDVGFLTFLFLFFSFLLSSSFFLYWKNFNFSKISKKEKNGKKKKYHFPNLFLNFSQK